MQPSIKITSNFHRTIIYAKASRLRTYVPVHISDTSSRSLHSIVVISYEDNLQRKTESNASRQSHHINWQQLLKPISCQQMNEYSTFIKIKNTLSTHLPHLKACQWSKIKLIQFCRYFWDKSKSKRRKKCYGQNRFREISIWYRLIRPLSTKSETKYRKWGWNVRWIPLNKKID